MNFEQQVEMRQEIRKQDIAGRPEVAQKIKKHLDAGVYWMPEAVTPKETPPPPNTNAKKTAWQKWAKDNTDIDHEVIETITRSDLIAMLRANGIIAAETNE